MSVQRPDVRNIQPIAGPFTVAEAHPPNADMGGVLDRGIVGRLPDGTKVVIGEIWAACPDDNHEKVSIDTDDMALRIVTALNCHDDLLAACKSAYQWSRFHGDDCKGRVEYEEGVIFDNTNGCTCYLSLLRAAFDKATGQAVTS